MNLQYVTFHSEEGANDQAILHDTDGDEGDGGLEAVMPWLQELHNLTRSCQFSKFWAEFNGSSEPAQRKLPHRLSRIVS